MSTDLSIGKWSLRSYTKETWASANKDDRIAKHFEWRVDRLDAANEETCAKLKVIGANLDTDFTNIAHKFKKLQDEIDDRAKIILHGVFYKIKSVVVEEAKQIFSRKNKRFTFTDPTRRKNELIDHVVQNTDLLYDLARSIPYAKDSPEMVFFKDNLLLTCIYYVVEIPVNNFEELKEAICGDRNLNVDQTAEQLRDIIYSIINSI